MDNVQERFACLLKQTLIPDFCSNTTRNVNPTGFCESRTRLFEIDMADFLRGWEAQLLKHKAGGLYRTVNGGAYEQFFWSGRKANVPRTFTLWVEPIITLGVLARMYWDFGWPKTLVDTQSKRDWAFDVLGRKSESDPSLLIACEVKKSCKEIDALISFMQRFGRHPRLSSERLKSSEKNAFRKVNALRRYKPGIFWAVGPNRHEKVFSVYYSEDGVIEFESASLQALNRIA